MHRMKIYECEGALSIDVDRTEG